MVVIAALAFGGSTSPSTLARNEPAVEAGTDRPRLAAALTPLFGGETGPEG
jgi:hypothetical protein